jgi:oligopeptide transport system substrate-binding protein
MVKDPSTALSLFEKGEIDHIGNPFTGLTLDAISSNRYADRLKSMEVARVYWININTERLPMNSAKIRKALSYVLDRKNLTTHLFMGGLPHKSPVPKNLSLLTEEEMYQDGDLAEGIKLFDEGLKELELTRETCPPLILAHSHLPGQKSLSEALQQIWQTAFGIEVRLEGSEWNTFFSRLNEGQFQLAGCFYTTWYSDPLYYLELFKDKEDRFINPSGWEHHDYKRLLNSLLAMDEKQKKEQLKKTEKLLLEEMPVIPIFVDTYKYMTHDKLDGFFINKSGDVDFKTAYFIADR